MNNAILQTVKGLLAGLVEREIPRVLDRKLPAAVEGIIRQTFAEQPRAALSPIGFRWAFYLALKARWPDVAFDDASAWLRDYLGNPIGSAGYEWTPLAAQGLAAEYAQEFGEQT